ncbi:hypothetical protein LTR50_005055 [Elasticomyces elasticus]|nr:hypothetical protein LTR50_005055 [Elasticomyces elasticus]
MAFRFLDLPPELRESVYTLLLNPSVFRRRLPEHYFEYDFSAALKLLKTNRQIYHEARKLFRKLNPFVRIETPWHDAQHHLKFDGHVPILLQDERADAFDDATLEITIVSPRVPFEQGEMHRFVIHVDDLDAFCKSWFYSDLTYPYLNKNLDCELTLRDPYAPDDVEDHPLPLALQRRLLLPFSQIKGLKAFTLQGPASRFLDKPLEEELRAGMAVPYMSAEDCLSRATKLKDEGNAALQAGRYEHALELYREGFRAMHIVILGRHRYIRGDRHFDRLMAPGSEYGDQHGQSVRLILRVRLVANTVLAYSKLKDYEEAAFWGMRSVNMLREAMGVVEGQELRPEDEAVPNFPAASEMGKIYYWTALACKKLYNKTEARRLLRVAQIYLPNDESVKKEIAACALKLNRVI